MSKTSEELYEERVNEAADEAYAKHSGGNKYPANVYDMFEEGLAWSNSNPSPKVQKLVEALELALEYARHNCVLRPAYKCVRCDEIEEIESALADFKKEG